MAEKKVSFVVISPQSSAIRCALARNSYNETMNLYETVQNMPSADTVGTEGGGRTMYKLLIVDDEPKIRNGLRSFFPWRELGFEVVSEASNGRQALEYLDANEADVVLCDIVMPKTDGIEFAQILHQRKHPAKLVFLTGHREFEYARQALLYGVKRYLVKPTQSADINEVFLELKAELDEERAATAAEDASPRTPTAGAEEPDDREDEAEAKGYHEKRIEAIERYVREHYADATLEAVSEAFHMNKHYLSKYYKRQTSRNFSDFVTSVKMKAAAAMLEDIHARVYEVGLRVGYDNAKNFSRAFKQYYGRGPREYRDRPDAMPGRPAGE